MTKEHQTYLRQLQACRGLEMTKQSQRSRSPERRKSVRPGLPNFKDIGVVCSRPGHANALAAQAVYQGVVGNIWQPALLTHAVLGITLWPYTRSLGLSTKYPGPWVEHSDAHEASRFFTLKKVLALETNLATGQLRLNVAANQKAHISIPKRVEITPDEVLWIL